MSVISSNLVVKMALRLISEHAASLDIYYSSFLF